MNKKKPKHGGKRLNAGRPSKYGEPLKAITFRVPESKVPEIKKLVKEALKTFEV